MRWGSRALVLILAEGGLTTHWNEIRPADAARACPWPRSESPSRSRSWRSAAHFVLGLPWELAILLGAVTSPTDAAAVFSVLRVVPLPKRLTGSLEAESGLNDAPTVVAGGAGLLRRCRRRRASWWWRASSGSS